MLTIENFVAFLFASFSIFVAGLLVRKQNKIIEETKKLNKEIENSLEEVANEVDILIGEEPSERTLTYLEKRMETFNKTLLSVGKIINRRENRNVKRKKNITND